MQPLKLEKKTADLIVFFSMALNTVILIILLIFLNHLKLGIGDIFSSSGLTITASYCLLFSLYYYFRFIRFWFFKKYANNEAHFLWLLSILNNGLFIIYTTWVVHLFIQTFSYFLLLVFLPNLILIGLSIIGLLANSKSIALYQS